MIEFKSSKRKILSVLLFSFLFLALHDFVMPKMELTKSYDAISYELELSEEIHKSIHSLFTLESAAASLTYYLLVLFEPSLRVLGFASSYNCVLERPPLH
jgi:hypothetical protein